MIDIQKLKRAALAATQGEWGSYETKVYLSGAAGGFDIGCSPNAEANATHIAEASPSAVLELIDRLEAAEKSAKDWEESAQELATQDSKMIDIQKLKQAALEYIRSGIDDAYLSINVAELHDLITRLESAEKSAKDWEESAQALATQDNKNIADLSQYVAVLEAKLDAAELMTNAQRKQLIAKDEWIAEAIKRLETAEQDAARYKTLQDMSGLCFNYAAEYQFIGRLNDYVDAIKPQVDKAIAAMKESK